MENDKPEVAEEKTTSPLWPGIYLPTINPLDGGVILTPIISGYPEIYQSGYVEKTPNPGGGESVFFG